MCEGKVEIFEIFEPASTDGDRSLMGDKIYYENIDDAILYGEARHGNYSVPPFKHKAIKNGDGRYLILVSSNPVSIFDSESYNDEVRLAALAKLTDKEIKLLGLDKEKI